jgi:hypothetical protein
MKKKTPPKIDDHSVESTKLLIPGGQIPLNPALAMVIGFKEAIVLQQFHYWSANSRHRYCGRRWFYNTLAEWQYQFPFWNSKTVSRTIKSLKAQGLIKIEQLNKPRFDRTNWYSINYDEFDKLVQEVNNVAAQLAKSQTDKAIRRRKKKGHSVTVELPASSVSPT